MNVLFRNLMLSPKVPTYHEMVSWKQLLVVIDIDQKVANRLPGLKPHMNFF